jgi:hypothetical protein
MSVLAVVEWLVTTEVFGNLDSWRVVECVFAVGRNAGNSFDKHIHQHIVESVVIVSCRDSLHVLRGWVLSGFAWSALTGRC